MTIASSTESVATTPPGLVRTPDAGPSGVPEISVETPSVLSSPPSEPQFGHGGSDPHDMVAELAVAGILTAKLIPETLMHALERGSSAAAWLGHEQVKFWTLEEKAGKLLRTLKRDPLFAELVTQSKEAQHARAMLLADFEAARRGGDRPRARDTHHKIAVIDHQIRGNLTKRDEWENWRVYRRLGREIAERLHRLRDMWEASERVPFQDAWKGEFGDH